MTEFVERLMKHASNGEVLMFKKPLDARLHQLLSVIPELNTQQICDLEFTSNFQAIQVTGLCLELSTNPRESAPTRAFSLLLLRIYAMLNA